MRCQIERKELLALLNKGLDYPLTLIVAAPGFGKSTLLTQWQNQQTQQKQKTIIRLDIATREDGLGVFKRLLNALKNTTPLWDASLFNLFKSESIPSPDEVVDVLIVALNKVDNRLVIMIDDYHNLRSPAISQILSLLIDRLPNHINLFLSTRMHPVFPVSRLAVEERVLVIDGSHLRLRKDEIVGLGQGVGVALLSDQQVTALLTQTEGWIVGVKLALLAYNRSGASALKTFSGSQPELLNYFGYEVLKKLSVELRMFVLSSSLFEQFNAELCEYVLGCGNSIAIMDKLVAQELFLMPVTGTLNWYRYHSLLQEFLQTRLLIEEGRDYVENVHRKAASYFLTRSELMSAIRHASQCGNADYYHSVLSDSCNHWLRSGEFDCVLGVLDDLPDALLTTKPFLTIPLIYALIFSRRFNQAHYYLELLKETENLTPSSGRKELKSPPSSARFLEHILYLFQRDADALTDINVLKFSHPQCNPDIRACSMVIVAYSLLYQGELGSAFKAASEAKTRLEKMGHTFLESYADLIVVLCDRYLGRGVDAIQYMTERYRHVEDGPRSPVWVNLATGMMVVHYEKNELESARHLCEKLLPVVNYSCATEVVTTVYLHFAKLIHIEGTRQKSTKLLEQLDRILSLGNYDRFQSQVVQETMRQAIVDESFNVADSLVRKCGLSGMIEQDVWREGNHYQESKERYGLAAVYWLATKGRFDRASNILTQLIATLDRHGVKTRALIARCNQVVINFRRGKRDLATTQLKTLLNVYGLICFSRSVFDESLGLERVFQHAISQHRITLPQYFTDLFDDVLSLSSVGSAVQIRPESLLTEKELEIFELLAAGLSNTDISQQTEIAVSTTKWHLKNIYSKLGVTNRSGAIMIAHQR